jgi:hypothetical protein
MSIFRLNQQPAGSSEISDKRRKSGNNYPHSLGLGCQPVKFALDFSWQAGCLPHFFTLTKPSFQPLGSKASCACSSSKGSRENVIQTSSPSMWPSMENSSYIVFHDISGNSSKIAIKCEIFRE